MRRFELLLPTDDRFPSGRQSLDVEAADELYIPKLLERDGLAAYEASTLACYLALVEQHGGPVLDVGANVGVFALVAAVLDVEVTAFEPVPELAAVVDDLASRNGLSVGVESLALGAEDAEATFYLSDVTDSSNSLLAGFRPSERSLTAQVATLDGYCQQRDLVPRVIKIDTEATEPDVLTGGLETIRAHRPAIICEVLAGRTEPQLEELLADLGYRWYQLTEELPPPARREVFGDRTYRFNNWLFAPEAPDEAFWERVRSWREALRDCVPPVAEPPPAPAPAVPPTPVVAAPPSPRPRRHHRRPPRRNDAVGSTAARRCSQGSSVASSPVRRSTG